MKKTIPIICMTLLMFSCDKGNNTKQTVNPTPNNDKTIMAIFPHADDELPVLPILSKYAKEGVNIYLVIVTDGSKGVKAHAKIPAGDSLAKVRSEEALCVTTTLGINPPILLNYVDGDLALGDNVYSLDDKIDSLFNKYQPDVILTWGPDGAYGNPDHRILSTIVTEVFQSEGSRTIQQLLYVGFLKESLDLAPELNTGPANWFKENLKTIQRKFLTYRIPVVEEDFKVAREALGCYKSQFTTEVMDEIYLLLGQTEGLIYLRPWNGSEVVKDDVFE